jgi:hypothetical protein
LSDPGSIVPASRGYRRQQPDAGEDLPEQVPRNGHLTPFRTFARRLSSVPKAQVDERDRKWREAKAEKREARENGKTRKT